MTIRTWLWLCVLALSTSLPLDAGERLRMVVSPRVSQAPADVFVRVTVEPHADNRALELVAESDEFYRSSLIQLDGELAPQTITMEFRSLPGGDYEIRGFVTDSVGHSRASARMPLTVVPSVGSRRP